MIFSILHQPKRELYTGEFLKQYTLRSIAKKKPWWYAIRWLKWQKWFWPVYGGFSINGKLHLTEKMSFTNALLIGKTGSGKTSAIISSTILRMTESSLVITDTGELHTLCSGILKKRGYDVRVLDVAHPETDTLNPMLLAQDKSDIQASLDILIQSSFGGGNGGDQFWNENAKSILSPIYVALMNQPHAEYKTFSNLRHCLLNFGKTGEALFKLIADYCDEQSYQEFKSFLDQDPKVIQSSLSTAKSCLSIFQDPHLQKLTASSSFELRQVRERKTALFIKIPEGKVEPYRAIISMLYNAIFHQLMKAPKPYEKSVFLILDEFANSGIPMIPSFPSICTQIRKKRAGLLMCVQDLGQLGELGTHKMSTIVEGATATKIYLPGMSLETAKYLESIIGLRSKTYENHLHQTQEAVRPVYTADELKLLPHNSCIVETLSNRPALLQLFPFYENYWLRRLTKRKPVKIDNSLADQEVKLIRLPVPKP